MTKSNIKTAECLARNDEVRQHLKLFKLEKFWKKVLLVLLAGK